MEISGRFTLGEDENRGAREMRKQKKNKQQKPKRKDTRAKAQRGRPLVGTVGRAVAEDDVGQAELGAVELAGRTAAALVRTVGAVRHAVALQFPCHALTRAAPFAPNKKK